MSLQQLLGTAFPLIQAPMAGVQGSAMAVAVSRAGGLGSLPCAMLSLDTLEKELQTLAASGDLPFNVNFFCHQNPRPDNTAEQAWQAALAPYYRRFSLAPPTQAGPGRAPFSPEAAALLAQFKPRVLSFHFGLPDAALLASVRGWGGVILASATTVAEAKWLEKQGVDAIIAQGLEAGGHRGVFLCDDPLDAVATQVGLMALLPQCVKAVSVPVIAAGGIADAAGVSAAMRLGASGVQIGTSYLLCNEASTTALHRAALQNETGQVTALTNLFTGRPARGIVNQLMKDLGPLNRVAPAFPMATSALAPLRAHAEDLGIPDFSPLWAGQNVSGCLPIGAYELTRQLALGFD
jgi:nitronate monooxygenase